MNRLTANKFVQMTGCAMVMAAFVIAGWFIGAKTSALFIASLVAVLLIVRGLLLARRAALVKAFRETHEKAGRDVLIVYSDSPHWSEYIEENWLSRWANRAVVLNRSRPWSHDQLEVRLWRALAGVTEHTPVVIVIPSHGKVEVIRFFKAFRDHKHGKSAGLREQEQSLEQILEKRP